MGYEDTRQKILSTLMQRPNNTEIQPGAHQDFALSLLEYIRSVELISGSTLIGVAEEDTMPVQSNIGNESYIAGVPSQSVIVYKNFINKYGEPISVITENESKFVILFWNKQYWEKQEISISVSNQSFVNVGLIKDEQHYDSSGWVDGKGMNSLGESGFYRGIYFDTSESFFLIVIDSKQAANFGLTSLNWVTQIKYGSPINGGDATLKIRRGAPKLDDLDVPIEGEFDWGEWKDFISGTANIEAEAPLSQKDGKLTLNIGDGLKVENNKLVATPQSSSDTSALRALFIAAGAEYNDSGVDIIKATPWAAFVDEIDFKAFNNIDVLNYTTADLLSIVQDGTTYQYVIDNGVYKVVARASRGQFIHDERFCVHRAGHYYLNGLGDITEEQMLSIYNHGNTLAIKYFLNTYKGRTNRMLISMSSTAELDGYYYARDCEAEVVTFDKGGNSIVSVKSPDNVYGNMFKLTHLLGRFRFESAASNSFYNCKLLKTVKIFQLKYNLSLSDCPLISKVSLLYAINNSAATAAITITLHANAYARLKDNPEVVAALESKPLVTLVSA